MKTPILILTFLILHFSLLAQSGSRSGSRLGARRASTLATVTPASDTTKWYFSITGNDSNDGHSTSTPKQTIAELNTLALEPGDQVLFKAGETFTGAITVNNSGTSANPIIFDSYGTGTAPVISGFATVTNWTNTTGNIWVSNSAVSTLSTVNMVVINDEVAPMGRTPNTGYYYFQSHSDDYHITSSDLTGTPDYTGAELAFNSDNWTTRRVPITGQSTGTLTFTQPESFTIATDGLKFIIQNDSTLLDQQNEYYYNTNTKKLVVYSTSNPGTVLVSAVSTLVDITSKDYITIKNLKFTGSNEKSINLLTCDNVTITNCDFDYSGREAVYGGGFSTVSDSLTITYCTFNNSNNGSIGVTQYFENANISYNIVTNSGMIFGAGCVYYSGTNNSGGLYGIAAQGNGSTFEYNVIDNIGYIGLKFRGSDVTVRYNYVTDFCQVNHDGGGIYTVNTLANAFSGTKVYNNISVADTIIKETGHTISDDAAIYFDDHSRGIEIYNNTTENKNGIGMTVKGNYLDVHHNNIFNSKYGIKLRDVSGIDGGSITINSNIVIATNTSQLTYYTLGGFNVIDSLTADYNYLDRPTNRNNIISSEGTYYDLAGWQSYSGNDANSTAIKPTVSGEYGQDLFYNATASTTAVTLPTGTWYEADSTAHTTTVSLPAFTSKILFDNLAPDTIHLGYTTVGGLSASYSDDIVSMPVTAPQDIEITSIAIYHSGASQNLLVGVYSNSSTLPGSLLATSDAVATNSTAGWQTIDLTSPLTVSNGTTVWIAYQASTGITARRQTGQDRSRSADAWTGALPTTQTTPALSGSNIQVSMYCVAILQ